MKTIRFGKKEDSTVIDIDDVKESYNKIYCYSKDGDLHFLDHRETVNKKYFWIDLFLGIKSSCGGLTGFDTFKEALTEGGDENQVLIFDSQCEVLEYAKKC